MRNMIMWVIVIVVVALCLVTLRKYLHANSHKPLQEIFNPISEIPSEVPGNKRHQEAVALEREFHEKFFSSSSEDKKALLDRIYKDYYVWYDAWPFAMDVACQQLVGIEDNIRIIQQQKDDIMSEMVPLILKARELKAPVRAARKYSAKLQEEYDTLLRSKYPELNQLIQENKILTQEIIDLENELAQCEEGKREELISSIRRM